jgi:hypothetical protein
MSALTTSDHYFDAAHYLAPVGCQPALFSGSIPYALQDLRDIDRRFRKHSQEAIPAHL